MDQEHLHNAKKNVNSELFMGESAKNACIFIVISETILATLSYFYSMLVPYDRRYSYCSSLAVHPSVQVVAAESKALISLATRSN